MTSVSSSGTSPARGRGPDVKRLQYVMGHGSGVITLDVYGHLFPTEDQALYDMVLSADGQQRPCPFAV